MNDIDIAESLEKQEQKEEEQMIRQAVQEEKDDGKSIVVTLVVLFGIVFLAIGGFKAYDHFTGADVVDVDQLHIDNLEGDLDPEEAYVYNGFSFVYADMLWWTEIQQGDTLTKIPLHFGPREVEEVKIKGKLDAMFNNGTEVYMAIDPELSDKFYTLALSEINFNAVKGLGKMPVGACTWNKTGVCDDRPIYNCSNTDGKPVIQFEYGGESKITLDGTCVKISGTEYGIVKAANRLVWQWYGVMG